MRSRHANPRHRSSSQRRHVPLGTLFVSIISGTPASAAAQPAAGDASSVVTLSPFEVNSSKDVGYLAKDTLAGSLLNTSHKDVAAQISIMTPEFLQDVGAVTMEDAFRYSLNIESTDEF